MTRKTWVKTLAVGLFAWGITFPSGLRLSRAAAQDEAPPATRTVTTPDEPSAPAEPETPEPAPAEPQPPEPEAPETKSPRLPLQAGEVLYEGTVESVSFANRRFTLRATSFTLPDGSQTQLTVPLYRVVHFDPAKPVAAAPYPVDGTEPRWVSGGLVWTRHAVAVVCPAAAEGQELEARLIELGEVQTLVAAPPGPAPEATTYFSGVMEHVAASGLRNGPKLGVTDFSGRTPRAANPNSDHPRGLALDFMVGRNAKRGDLVAAFFEANMGVENVAYIIWKDHLVHPGARTDWAKLPVDYGPGMTARHMDHVHVSFLAQPLTPGPWLTPRLVQAASSASGPTARRTRRKRSPATRALKSRR